MAAEIKSGTKFEAGTVDHQTLAQRPVAYHFRYVWSAVVANGKLTADRQRMTRILPMLFCAAILSAQQAREVSRIDGRTVNSFNGQPAAGAVVTLFNSDNGDTIAETTADDAGRFFFAGVAPRSYRITAEAEGFLQTEYRNADTLALDPGLSKSGVLIKLIPYGSITGRIFAAPERPAIGVKVVALRAFQVGSTRRTGLAAETVTDSTGAYRLPNLAPGTYLLAADRPDLTSQMETGPVATFYPNAEDANAASAVRLAPGQEASGTDIQLLQEPVHAINGKVIGDSAKLQLRLFQPTAALPFAPVTVQPGSDASFHFLNVAAGSYKLSLIQSVAPRRTLASIPINVGRRDVTDIEITPGELQQLAGTFHMEDGSPPPRAEIQLTLGTNGDGVSTSADQAGRFQFKDLGPEFYGLNFARLPQGSSVKSATWSGQDVLTNGLDLHIGGAANGTLDIIIGTKSASVEGVVKLPSGRSGTFMVVVAPDPPRPQTPYRYRRTLADSTGHFVVGGLPPGQYRIFATEEDESVLDLDFMSVAAPAKLELHEGQREAAEAPLLEFSQH